MKKMFLFAAILFAVSFCLFGCERTEPVVVEIGDDGSMPSGTGELPDRNSGELPSRGNGEKSFGTMPDGKTLQAGSAPDGSTGFSGENGAVVVGDNETVGEVQSIAGNYVTLRMGESVNGSITYGEEEKSYLLPVGMSIGTGDFSSVTAGMVLKLTFEEGSDTITAVNIISR